MLSLSKGAHYSPPLTKGRIQVGLITLSLFRIRSIYREV
jgi:hypothetical protein